jgi:2-methylcitrate dehydratase PrpD
MTTILDQFARRLTRAGSEKELALHLLDTLGAWYAAARTEDSVLLDILAAPVPGIPPALSDGMLDKIAHRIAVIRNSEIDDIHMESCTTPGAVVVPVALTLAASIERPKAAVFATALAAGYEAMTRLSAVVSGESIRRRGIWPTLFTAPVGAAATAAVMLGLDAARIADAIAMALILTGGAPGTHGEASPRWILLGQAGRAGTFCALAAGRGLHGDRTLLDGDWLLRTHGIVCDPAPLTIAPESTSAIDAVSYKPYCSAKQCVAAIDGFRRILSRTSVDAIASVQVYAPPTYVGMIGQSDPSKGRIERIASAAYQFALAAYRPALLVDVIRPDLTQDDNIAAFMPRVAIVADESLSRYFPQVYPARVEATLRDGGMISEFVTDATGDPTSGYRGEDVLAKFLDLAGSAIGNATAESLAASALDATTHDSSLAALAAAIEWGTA